MPAARRRTAPDPVDTALAALADPARRRAVDLLRGAPMRSGELSDLLGLSPSTVSKHLRVLSAAGLVAPSLTAADGRGRVYALRPERLNELSAWLEEVRAMWTGQLGALKAHVEAGRRKP